MPSCLCVPIPVRSSLRSRQLRPFSFGLLAGVWLLAGVLPTFAATLTVTNTNDSGTGSLRAAIAAAAPGDTIQFAAGLTGTITLTSGELLISKDLTITGPGASVLAVSGNNASRVFEISSDVTVAISSLTIENGVATGSNGLNSGGGGILNRGMLTLTNSTVASNSAGLFGAGIFSNGTLTITNSTVSGNSTIFSNAAAGGIFSSGTLTITNSTVSGNSTILNGGGIFNDGTATLTNSTVAANSAGGYGGGINNGTSGVLTLTNSTVAGNTATGGGGLSNIGTVTSKSTLLASNNGGNCYFDAGSANTSQGYNLSDDNKCASVFTATGDLNNVAAGLASTTPQNNGGPTQTIALLPTSPAVDHIAVAQCTVATDQRGVTRPQGAACDVGAFELVENAPTISKSFGATTILLNGTTSLSFTITAPTGNAVTSVNFTDTLPSGLVVATPNGLSGSCDSGTITAGAGTVSLSGASLAAGVSCTFSVNVTGTTLGMKPNQVTINSDQGTGNMGTASLTVLMPPPPLTPPTISKSFEPSSIGVNESSTLSFTLTNPNTMASLRGVSFTDTLPAGLVVATPSGVSGSCGAGTISAVAGSSLISLSGGMLAANSSCSFSVRVTAFATGALPNTTSTVTATESGPGLTASATLTASSDAYQLNYAANLNQGDGVVNLTNSGASAGENSPVVGQNSYGDICVNAYVYAPDQELATCCSCLVSPNSLHSWPVSFGTDNLLQNVTNQAVLDSINQSHTLVIKLLATPAGGDLSSASGAVCPGPANPGTGVTALGGITGLANGLVAWGTHAYPTNTATVAITETTFVPSTLSAGELAKLTNDCRALLTRGGGRVCPACQAGGLATSDTLTPKLP